MDASVLWARLHRSALAARCPSAYRQSHTLDQLHHAAYFLRTAPGSGRRTYLLRAAILLPCPNIRMRLPEIAQLCPVAMSVDLN